MFVPQSNFTKSGMFSEFGYQPCVMLVTAFQRLSIVEVDNQAAPISE